MFSKKFPLKPIKPYAAVLPAALFVKIVLLTVIVPAAGAFLGPRYGIGFGPDAYDILAKNLIQGVGYRLEPGAGETMSREPGHVLYLATLFKISGYHIESILIGNFLLMCSAAVMVIHLMKRVTKEPIYGVVAALLMIFHPAIIIAEWRGGLEVLFLTMTLLYMVVLHRAMEEWKVRRHFAAGVALGVLVMIRSTPVLFPLSLALYWICTTPRKWALHIKATLGMSVGMAIIMSPWTVRNYVLVGQLAPMATIAGAAAQEGVHICKCLTFDRDFRDVVVDSGAQRNRMAEELGFRFKKAYHQVFYSARDELEFSRKLFQKAVQEYLTDPLFFLSCVTKRFWQMWLLGKTWSVTWLNGLLQIPMLTLAAYGAYLLWRRGELRNMAVMLAFVAYMVGLHSVINAHARYSVPLLPFVAMLSSVALVSLYRQIKGFGPGHSDQLSSDRW